MALLKKPIDLEKLKDKSLFKKYKPVNTNTPNPRRKKVKKPAKKVDYKKHLEKSIQQLKDERRGLETVIASRLNWVYLKKINPATYGEASNEAILNHRIFDQDQRDLDRSCFELQENENKMMALERALHLMDAVDYKNMLIPANNKKSPKRKKK